LQDTSRNECAGRPRQCTTGGGNSKQSKPDQKGSATAREVGNSAAKDQQPAEHQRVGGEHPLQLGVAEPQRLADRRQGGGNDRDIEHHHELGNTDNCQS
jgi:hypothetical protein